MRCESTGLHHCSSRTLLLFLLLSSSPDAVISFRGSLLPTVLPTTAPFRKLHRHHASPPSQQTSEKKDRRRNLPGKIIRIYTDYASRLWKETNPEARHVVQNGKVAMALRQVQSMIQEQGTMNHVPAQERLLLFQACDTVLKAIAIHETKLAAAAAAAAATTTTHHNRQVLIPHANGDSTDLTVSSSTNDATNMSANDDPLTQGSVTAAPAPAASMAPVKPKRTRRSIGFGAVMGLVVACWVFSGNYIFTGLFTLMTILGQLEYYRMVMNTGIYPARRISVVGACSMFLAALFTPELHQIVLPMSGLWAMVWFLTMRRRVTHIPEIATTFTGMFYLGYVPSFWVRIRLIGMGREPTRLAPLVGPVLRYLEAKGKTLPSFIPQAIHLPITTGAIFIFWTWLCLAFSDVGAYFVGRYYGKTKLGVIAPAAGATSPNKTIEGVVGGCAVSAVLAILGAWVQRWPHPVVTGAIHGVLLGLLGLLGDLTASMLKRDAGLKDFGDLLPEHGGIMDRVDSFIWAAPYSWIVCRYVVPALKKMYR